MRRVLVEQDDLAPLERRRIGFVAVPRQCGLLVAGEHLAAAGDLLDVLVLGHHPVAVVAECEIPLLLLLPPDRRHLAHVGQLVDGQPLGVDIGVREVETGWEIRRRHRCTPQVTLSSALWHCYTTVGGWCGGLRQTPSETCSRNPKI